VSLVGQFPMVIIAGTNTQITDIKTFVARAGREPSLEIGTPGAGTMGDLTASMLESATKTKVLHVPYAGGAPALNATLANQIPLATDVVNGTVIGMISSGKVNGVAITSAKRFSGLPNLPTAAEQGYPQIEAGVHFALVGPAKLPAAIITKLNGEIDRYLTTSEARAKLESLGAEVIGGKPEAVTAMMRDSLKRWEPIIKANAIEPR
jgi:tripartite-type tricarboxylate transporter receptor subunit TctC